MVESVESDAGGAFAKPDEQLIVVQHGGKLKPKTSSTSLLMTSKSEIPIASMQKMTMIPDMDRRAAFSKKLKIGDRSGVNYEMPLKPEKAANGHVYRPDPISSHLD